jgi:hypothetical protein
MLWRVGSSAKLSIRRKHRPVWQFRNRGTEFRFGQHDYARQHWDVAVGHDSNDPRLHVAQRNFSQQHRPGLNVAQRDGSGFDIARRNARSNDSRLDVAQRHAEHDAKQHYSWINVSKRDTGCYQHAGIDFAERYSQYNYAGKHVASNYAARKYAAFNHAARFRFVFFNNGRNYLEPSVAVN